MLHKPLVLAGQPEKLQTMHDSALPCCAGVPSLGPTRIGALRNANRRDHPDRPRRHPSSSPTSNCKLDALRTGTIPVILPLDHPKAWVAPRNIAEVAVTRLLSADWSGRLVQAVHGSADLSWAEAAEIVGTAIDRPLRVERISDDAMRELLRRAGMTDALVDAVIGMSTGLRDGFVPEKPRNIHTTTPTTLASWAYEGASWGR